MYFLITFKLLENIYMFIILNIVNIFTKQIY